LYVKRVPKSDYKLNLVGDQSRQLASFKLLVKRHGATSPIIKALGLNPRDHKVIGKGVTSAKKKTVAKKVEKPASKEEE
jgi:hypothetical protein